MACNTRSSFTGDIRSCPILVATNNPETKFLLDTSFFTVGRLFASYCIKDENISRYHCFFTLEDETWKLYDVSSSGTYVNDLKLKAKEPRMLIDRDVIQFGVRPMNTYVFYADSREYEEKVAKLNSMLKRKLVSFGKEILKRNRRIQSLEKNVQTLRAKIDETKKYSEEYAASISDIIEAELKCIICCELLCEAVSLSCGHMICKFCLLEWKRNAIRALLCPFCRECVRSEASAYPVNSVLSAVIPKLSEDVKAARYKVLLDRGINVSDLDQLKPRTELIDLTEDSELPIAAAPAAFVE